MSARLSFFSRVSDILQCRCLIFTQLWIRGVGGAFLLGYIDAAAVVLGCHVPACCQEELLIFSSSRLHLSFKHLFICVYICVGVLRALAMGCEWRSNGDCWIPLSSHHVGPSGLVASTHAHAFHSL